MTRAILLMTCFVVLQAGCKTASMMNGNLKNSDYNPVKPGSVWLYQYAESPVTLTTRIDTVLKEIEGKKYYKIIRNYSGGQSSESFIREEDDVVYSFDYRANVESVIIPKQIKTGATWLEGDKSWEYKIINTNASIITPSGTYTDLLHVRAVQQTERDQEKASRYDLYYKNGVGLVATEVKGKVLTYLVRFELR